MNVVWCYSVAGGWCGMLLCEAVGGHWRDVPSVSPCPDPGPHHHHHHHSTPTLLCTTDISSTSLWRYSFHLLGWAKWSVAAVDIKYQNDILGILSRRSLVTATTHHHNTMHQLRVINTKPTEKIIQIIGRKSGGKYFLIRKYSINSAT